jgi:hypothetical protein
LLIPPPIADKPLMMNFSTAGFLVGMIVSTLGFSIFLYGKNVQRFWPLAIGLAMMTYPWFIYSPLLLWSITALLCVVLYLMREKD